MLKAKEGLTPEEYREFLRRRARGEVMVHLLSDLPEEEAPPVSDSSTRPKTKPRRGKQRPGAY